MLTVEVSWTIRPKSCFTFVENADKRLRREDAIELVLLGVTDTAASDFTSEIWKKKNKKEKDNIKVPTAQQHIGIMWPELLKTDVWSNLHIRRDIRVTVVHSFHRAPAVVAVIIAACALSCVHRQAHSAVQVLLSPAGHIRVRRFARIWLRAARTRTHTHTHTHFSFKLWQFISLRSICTFTEVCKNFIYLPWLSVLCRSGFILRAGISFWGDSCWAEFHGGNFFLTLEVEKTIYCQLLSTVEPVGMRKYSRKYRLTRLLAATASLANAERSPSLLSYSFLFVSLMRRSRKYKTSSGMYADIYFCAAVVCGKQVSVDVVWLTWMAFCRVRNHLHRNTQYPEG